MSDQIIVDDNLTCIRTVSTTAEIRKVAYQLKENHINKNRDTFVDTNSNQTKLYHAYKNEIYRLRRELSMPNPVTVNITQSQKLEYFTNDKKYGINSYTSLIQKADEYMKTANKWVYKKKWDEHKAAEKALGNKPFPIRKFQKLQHILDVLLMRYKNGVSVIHLLPNENEVYDKHIVSLINKVIQAETSV